MRTGERRRRLPNWAIGLILVFFLAIASVYAFTKSVPWSNKYTVEAVFTSASNVRPSSPVRIAGVNVGKVTKVEHLSPDEAGDLSVQASDGPVPDGSTPSTASVVTMELEESALPLRTDATMKLRPRLFLEGNLFIDLKPGSPNAEEAEDGYVFPINQTSVAVQLDQVLTTLQGDVRSDLQTLLDEFGNALSKHGGAEGFREIYETSPGAFRYTSVVNEAFLGTEEGDLSDLIVNLDTTVEALNRGGGELQDLVGNLRTVLGSFAAESDALEQGLIELPGVLEEGRPALATLNEAFPSVRAFAREALPGVRSTPATLDATTPLLREVRGLVSEEELRGLTADLRPTIPRLAELARTTIPFLDEARPLASCFNEVVIPWSNQTIDDPQTPATGRIFEQLSFGLVGLSGESRSNDANGPYIRTLPGSGSNGVVIPNGLSGEDAGEDAVGFAPAPLVGAIPAIEDSAKTPFRPDVPCERQDPPDLSATTNFDISGIEQGPLEDLIGGDLPALSRADPAELDAVADQLDEAQNLPGARGAKLLERGLQGLEDALTGGDGLDLPQEGDAR